MTSPSTGSDPLRLPQDAALSGRTAAGRDLSEFTDPLESYADRHARAVKADDFSARANSCWGLIAHGVASLPWVERELASMETDRVEDAAGVLWWIGAPASWSTRLHRVVASLPEGAAADAVLAVIQQLEGPDASNPSCQGADSLLDGRWAPFTHRVWFIDAPLDAVLRSRRDWAAEHDEQHAIAALSGDLSALLDRLEPTSWLGWRDLYVETESSWTAMFSQGGDSAGARVVAIREGWRLLEVGHSPHVVRDGSIANHGGTHFQLTDRDRISRVVHVSYQSRWEFYTYGEVLPFEELDSYGERRVRDRFTTPMLNRYCRALGIRLPDSAFYGPRGALVERENSHWPHRPQTQSSAGWRAERL